MKIFFLASLLVASFGAIAAPQECKHSPIPKIKDSLQYEKHARNKVIKAGWKPVAVTDEAVMAGSLYNKNIPEAACSAPGCTYQYSDKYNNQLFIYAGDVVTEVELECKN